MRYAIINPYFFSIPPIHQQLAERYTAVVRRPIDLTTVARRLRRGTYDNAAGRLRRDIIRIFSNCEKFNLTTSQLLVGIARDLRVRQAAAMIRKVVLSHCWRKKLQNWKKNKRSYAGLHHLFKSCRIKAFSLVPLDPP